MFVEVREAVEGPAPPVLYVEVISVPAKVLGNRGGREGKRRDETTNEETRRGEARR